MWVFNVYLNLYHLISSFGWMLWALIAEALQWNWPNHQVARGQNVMNSVLLFYQPCCSPLLSPAASHLVLDVLPWDRDHMRRTPPWSALVQHLMDMFGPRSEVLHNVDGTRLVQSSEDTTYPLHIPSYPSVSDVSAHVSAHVSAAHPWFGKFFMGFHGVVWSLHRDDMLKVFLSVFLSWQKFGFWPGLQLTHASRAWRTSLVLYTTTFLTQVEPSHFFVSFCWIPWGLRI